MTSFFLVLWLIGLIVLAYLLIGAVFLAREWPLFEKPVGWEKVPAWRRFAFNVFVFLYGCANWPAWLE
jgi:hypothetical protein